MQHGAEATAFDAQAAALSTAGSRLARFVGRGLGRTILSLFAASMMAGIGMVNPLWTAAATVPSSRPQKAPCPVVRFQNMPSMNVAKSGAFTNAETNCSRSMMLLNWFAT